MSEKGVSFSANEDQDSLGDLNSTFNPPSRDFEKSIEPIEIAGIEHFSGIPDFIDPTRSPYPIIVKSPSSVQCIDGWELIEQAKQRGETSIICEIIHIQLDSEIECALWKSSVRVMPIGGRCIYPEEVRNTFRLFTMLCDSAENPVIFEHGGARRGDSYENSREKNIRFVLADRLGKRPKTINKYLSHGRFISDEAFLVFIDARINKGFFETFQREKQRLIDDLKAEQKTHDEIVKAVSDRMLLWLKDFQTDGFGEGNGPPTNPDEPPATEIQSQHNDAPSPPEKPIEHKHWSGNPSASLEKPLTEDEIYQQFIAVGRVLIETAENTDMAAQDRIEVFSAQVFRQTRLIQNLSHLMKQQSINREEHS